MGIYSYINADGIIRVSIFGVFTYLMGLNIVLENIDKVQNLIAYCLGWGSGVYLGSKIEQWLALGYVTV